MYPVRSLTTRFACLVIAGAALVAAPADAQTRRAAPPAEPAAGPSKVEAITIKQSSASAYLKIDGIKGEAADARHKGEIEIYSYSWGETQAGRTRPARIPGTLTITKPVDVSSVALTDASRTGRRITQMTLTLPSPSGGPPETVTLYQVLVTSIERTSGGDRPTESISFNFQKIE